MVVDRNFCTTDEVQECFDSLRKLAAEDKHYTLAEVLVQKGFVTKSQMQRLKKVAEESSPASKSPAFR